MNELKFRRLKAGEIECRIATVKENGVSLLLYKDARVDQNILDETVGPMNWQRRHSRENANCIVSLWDDEKKQWVEKEDTGTESYTEKEKGLASDSFKRSCFNWGIGRELYTAPFIWIDAANCEIKEKGSKAYTCYDRFSVQQIEYDDDGKINSLAIRNEKKHKTVYRMGDGTQANPPVSTKPDSSGLTEAQVNTLFNELGRTGVSWRKMCKNYGVDQISHMDVNQFKEAMEILRKKPDKAPDPETIPPDDYCGLPFS